MKRLAAQADNAPPPLDIAPMTKCLHGHPCEHLDAPGGVSPMCHEAVNGIFNIRECPLGLWWMASGEPIDLPEDEKIEILPGDCDNCPASGKWEWGEYARQGLLCFHAAYFMGKPGKPKRCEDIRDQCPLSN